MRNSLPYEVTRMDSMQWNRTANIRAMREMVENCNSVITDTSEIPESVLADVKKAIIKEVNKENSREEEVI